MKKRELISVSVTEKMTSEIAGSMSVPVLHKIEQSDASGQVLGQPVDRVELMALTGALAVEILPGTVYA